MHPLLERLLGNSTWSAEWQEELSETLASAQRGLGTSMVVVISRESDLYSEVLFLLSFLGLSIGAIAGWLMKLSGEEALTAPLLGFALGSTLFAFRRFFISRMAPRAIRDRVAGRAKSLFFDHHQHLKGKLALLYVSELEREALFLVSPELIERTPSREVQSLLSKLVIHYDRKQPMRTLGPAITTLGETLQRSYGPANASEGETRSAVRFPQFVGAPSDRPAPFQVPILKGSKDIN